MRFRLLEPWRTRLLWLSLGLNVFAACLLGAPHVWRRHPPGPPSFDIIVGRLTRDLAPEQADAFRAVLMPERPFFEGARRRQDEAREQLARALHRDPFDPAAVSAALRTIQDSMQDAGTRFNDLLAAAIATLPPDGRTRMAAGLERRRP